MNDIKRNKQAALHFFEALSGSDAQWVRDCYTRDEHVGIS